MQTETNVDIEKNFTAIRNELLEKRIVESVTSSTSPATDIWWHTDIDKWPGKHPGETTEMGAMRVTEDYVKTMGMTIREGRDFSNNDTASVLFNETAIARLRIKEPVNQVITWNGTNYRIVGVVKDALMYSPFKPADPTMFFWTKSPESIMIYRLSPGIRTRDALTQLEAVFNKYNPAFPYKYSFADE